MAELFVREHRTKKEYKVLHIIKENEKTLFLVWSHEGNYFKWLDARKVELIETSWS